MGIVSEQSVWYNIDLDESFRVGVIYIEDMKTIIGGTYLDRGCYEEYPLNEFFSYFQFISEGKV